MTSSSVTLAWFGKLPTRGDFVRSAGMGPLTQILDRWLTQGMDLVSAATSWRQAYDRVAPMHFAFLGTQGRVGLAGHLVASGDASGRRFPFVVAGRYAVPLPSQAVLAGAPLALAPLWSRFEALSRRAAAPGDDPGVVLSGAAGGRIEIDLDPERHLQAFVRFLAHQTLEGLEDLLQATGHDVSLRQTLLAIGLLLQPALTQGVRGLERGLVLPVPRGADCWPLVCAMWLALVTPFLVAHDCEIAVFVRAAPRPQMVIGLNGASPQIFRALVDDSAGRDDLIGVSQADWVEAQLGQSYGLRKLSSHLEQPDLLLQTALDVFLETFLGAR